MDNKKGLGNLMGGPRTGLVGIVGAKFCASDSLLLYLISPVSKWYIASKTSDKLLVRI